MPAPLSPEVVTHLQASVSAHLTAVEFYTLASQHTGRIGYAKLEGRFAAEADDERTHLAAAIGRLEFFWQTPDLTHIAGNLPANRDAVPEILRAALALEMGVAVAERAAIQASRMAGDEGTAVALTPLLLGTEESIRTLEGDLLQIDQIGLDNWLANQG